jgi:hypothetical protein
MIIIDYSQISIASFYAQPNAELSEEFLRHMILNTIRMYSHKFKGEYGEIVIACDGGKSWRKGYFPQYKAHRKKAREDSGMDWNLFFQYLNQIREEIKENFPYKVIHLEHIEADDVIATLVKDTQEFGKNEPVMIISSDKDFIQLHKYKNVKQFSPIQKKMVTDPNPHMYLFEHVLRGDSGDGIPNVLSPDNTFVDGLRQTPITKKKIDAWLTKAEDIKSVMDDEVYRNYQRNKLLIDLDMIPQDYKESILFTYESQTVAPRARILDYLIKKRCKMLVESISEF